MQHGSHSRGPSHTTASKQPPPSPDPDTLPTRLPESSTSVCDLSCPESLTEGPWCQDPQGGTLKTMEVSGHCPAARTIPAASWPQAAWAATGPQQPSATCSHGGLVAHPHPPPQEGDVVGSLTHRLPGPRPGHRIDAAGVPITSNLETRKWNLDPPQAFEILRSHREVIAHPLKHLLSTSYGPGTARDLGWRHRPAGAQCRCPLRFATSDHVKNRSRRVKLTSVPGFHFTHYSQDTTAVCNQCHRQ